jgi:hypothetical protein
MWSSGFCWGDVVQCVHRGCGGQCTHKHDATSKAQYQKMSSEKNIFFILVHPGVWGHPAKKSKFSNLKNPGKINF